MELFRGCLARMVRHGEILNAASDMLGLDPLDAQSFMHAEKESTRLYASALESAMDYWTSQLQIIHAKIERSLKELEPSKDKKALPRKRISERDVQTMKIQMRAAQLSYEQMRSQRKAITLPQSDGKAKPARERLMARMGIEAELEEH